MTDRSQKLIRFLLVNAGLGVMLGFFCAGLIVWLDIAGLGGLIRRTAEPVLPLILLFGGFGVTFGAVVVATAVMMMPKSGPGRKLGREDSVWRDAPRGEK